MAKVIEMNRSERRAANKAARSAGEFKKNKDETVDQWEKRFVEQLPSQELLKLFATRAKAFKDISAQLTIMRNEIKRRNLK